MVAVAGCGFEHGIASSGGDGDPPDDAEIVVDTQMVVDGRPVDAPCEDSDNDSVCNADDDWPCGVKPAAPGATMKMTGNGGNTEIELTQVALDGTGRLAVATPSELVSLRFHYDIEDTACPGNCVDQIEVGWTPGARYGCPFDDPVSKQNGAQGNVNMQIRAPMTAGVYDLRANLGQNLSCTANGASNWWNSAPAASRTIAKLCVH